MSGIAGIFNLDGRPADSKLLKQMTDAIQHRGPDGEGQWTKGPIALGHRMLHTTPESHGEAQPMADESGMLCLTFDGRVDNRGELRRALRLDGINLRDDTDAELVLGAYQRWSEKCPEKIVGDYAFAVWDDRVKQLFCARDVQGIRPLYYYSDGSTFRFASELHQILLDPTVPRHPNESLIAEYLVSSTPCLNETVYHEIFQLPRAHTLIVQPSSIRSNRYWDIDWRRTIHYRTDEEYAESFFDVFAEAVRCRLRSDRPLAAELSGGLDSSAIVSTVEWLRQNRSMENVDFSTFSLSFPGCPWDEAYYVDEVVRKWGLRFNAVSECLPDISSYVQRVSHSGDVPYAPSGEMFSREMELIRKNGNRVVLTGTGGDLWLAGSPFHLADLLRALKIHEAFRQSYSETQIFEGWGKKMSTPQVVIRYGVWPLLPKIMQQIIKTCMRGKDAMPAWIAPEFARRTRLAERLKEREAHNTRCETIAQRRDIAPLLDYPFYNLIDHYASRFGLEYRHPFMDRRVIEYCLALPQEQLRRRNQTKFVLREAMKGILPEAVRKRSTKAALGYHAFWAALQALGGERFFGRLRVSSVGWVDGQHVRRMYQRTATYQEMHDPRYAAYIWPLWVIASLEVWFRIMIDGDDFDRLISRGASLRLELEEN